MYPSIHHQLVLAGAFAAFTVDLLIYPLDTLKTRIQSPLAVHRNLTLRSGLYQGLGPVILATMPASGAFFTTYEFARTLLPAHPLSASLASSVAEVVSCAILTPAEVVKQNAQVIRGGAATSRWSVSLLAFRRIRSVRDLWSGYSTLLARNLPYTALQFPVFEALKARLCPRGSSAQQTGLWSGVAAGSSGCVAAIVTTPVDVVKTRVMLAAGNGGEKRPVVVARAILRDEGVRALWKGGALRAVWTMFGSGMYLGVYEASKVWIVNYRNDRAGDDQEE